MLIPSTCSLFFSSYRLFHSPNLIRLCSTPQKGTLFTAAPILFVNGSHVRSIVLPSNITVRSVVSKWAKDCRKLSAK
jgi:hypothetical protein